jgi:hypothetical protein
MTPRRNEIQRCLKPGIMLRISFPQAAQNDRLPLTEISPFRLRDLLSACAWGRRRHGRPIYRVRLSGFCFGVAGRSAGFPVGCIGSLRRFLASGFDSFLRFSGYGLAGFLSFLAYGLASLFCFLPDGFGRLLCFLTYRLESVLNCFPCFLRAVLYVLNYRFLTNRAQQCDCN